MKELIKKQKNGMISIVFFIVFLLLGTYFIWNETWMFLVKIIIFIMLFLTLKSICFQKKD